LVPSPLYNDGAVTIDVNVLGGIGGTPAACGLATDGAFLYACTKNASTDFRITKNLVN